MWMLFDGDARIRHRGTLIRLTIKFGYSTSITSQRKTFYSENDAGSTESRVDSPRKQDMRGTSCGVIWNLERSQGGNWAKAVAGLSRFTRDICRSVINSRAFVRITVSSFTFTFSLYLSLPLPLSFSPGENRVKAAHISLLEYDFQ